MKPDDFKKQKEAVAMAIEMPTTLSLTSKDLPELKKWKVGQEYDIELTVKEKGVRQTSDGEMRADFEIISVSVAAAGEKD